jgi:hypothetical protein
LFFSAKFSQNYSSEPLWKTLTKVWNTFKEDSLPGLELDLMISLCCGGVVFLPLEEELDQSSHKSWFNCPADLPEEWKLLWMPHDRDAKQALVRFFFFFKFFIEWK